MKIAVVTILPDMFSIMFDHGVSGRAIKRGLVNLAVFNPRDFTQDIHRTVDSRPYGGGPGMIMMVEPLKKAVAAARSWVSESDTLVVYLSPQGQLLCHSIMKKSVERQGLILVAGRFEGVDERFIRLEVDEEWSIGDYILSGGELAAMVVSDAIIRGVSSSLFLLRATFTNPSSLNDASDPLILVPEVVLTLPLRVAPVGRIEVTCGFTISNGIF